jgi:hypothetical protein
MSALPPKADKRQTSRHVRFVPKADIRAAAKTSDFDHVIGDREVLGLTIPRPEEPQCDLLAGLAS